MIQRYTQTTYETCLAVSLLQAVGNHLKIEPKLELDCLIYSLHFSKDDFVSGHLDFIAKRFPVSILRIVDNPTFYRFLKEIQTDVKVKNECNKITLELLDSLLQKSSVILYLDAYILFKVHHYPHFVTVLRKQGKSYLIFDPWQGKAKRISTKKLLDGISSLRNHLKFTPQIIIVGHPDLDREERLLNAIRFHGTGKKKITSVMLHKARQKVVEAIAKELDSNRD